MCVSWCNGTPASHVARARMQRAMPIMAGWLLLVLYTLFSSLSLPVLFVLFHFSSADDIHFLGAEVTIASHQTTSLNKRTTRIRQHAVHQRVCLMTFALKKPCQSFAGGGGGGVNLTKKKERKAPMARHTHTAAYLESWLARCGPCGNLGAGASL